MKLERAINMSDGCNAIAVVLYLGTSLSVRQLKKIMRSANVSDDSSALDLADWYAKSLYGNSIEFLKVWQDNFKPIE